MNDGPGIVPLGRGQGRAVSRMLARAFDDDPMMTHVFPDPADRARRLPRMMGGTIRHAARYGRVRVAGKLAGAAVWLAPGTTDVTFPRMVRSGMIAMPFQLGPAAFGRLMALTNPLEAAHKRLMPAPHWYLFILGTDPARRGAGVGAALIEDGLGWADADGLPVSLETQNERNLAWYGRFGFTVAEEIESAGLRSWVPVRPAR